MKFKINDKVWFLESERKCFLGAVGTIIGILDNRIRVEWVYFNKTDQDYICYHFKKDLRLKMNCPKYLEIKK